MYWSETCSPFPSEKVFFLPLLMISDYLVLKHHFSIIFFSLLHLFHPFNFKFSFSVLFPDISLIVSPFFLFPFHIPLVSCCRIISNVPLGSRWWHTACSWWHGHCLLFRVVRHAVFHLQTVWMLLGRHPPCEHQLSISFHLTCAPHQFRLDFAFCLAIEVRTINALLWSLWSLWLWLTLKE